MSLEERYKNQVLAQVAISCRLDLMRFALDNGASRSTTVIFVYNYRNLGLGETQKLYKEPIVITNALPVSENAVYQMLSDKYEDCHGFHCLVPQFSRTNVKMEYLGLRDIIKKQCDDDLNEMFEFIFLEGS